jgi:hypothetical protein
MENGTTQPDNEKDYSFHLRLPALNSEQCSSPEFIGG